MLSDSIRILNFDDSVVKQKRLSQQFCPAIIDLKEIGPASRLWFNEVTSRRIKRFLYPQFKNAITLIGSGDFHHVSSLLIEQFQEPIGVIIFDHHPDWNMLPPRFGCGSWVTNILRKDNVKKIILLGVSSGDISSFWVQSGNLNFLKGNRVEIYPYQHGPTVTFLKNVPDNVSIRIERGIFHNKIYWDELKNRNLRYFIPRLIDRLETKKVYVSIDKDCLNSENSLTNWEEGSFTLDELLVMLKLIKESLDIVGLDITGDYSIPQVNNKFKAICSLLDHPKQYSAKGKSASSINAINEQANLKIIELLRN